MSHSPLDYAPAPAPHSSLGAVSCALGVPALVLFPFPGCAAYPIALVGLVLAIVGLFQPDRRKTLALIGLVLNLIPLGALLYYMVMMMLIGA